MLKAEMRLKLAVIGSVRRTSRNHSNREELKTLGVAAHESSVSLLANTMQSVMESRRRQRLLEAFAKIDSKCQARSLQEDAIMRLQTLVAARLRGPLTLMRLAGFGASAGAKENVAQGAIVLFRLFFMKQMHNKSDFFRAGKRLFEQERQSTPIGARGKLVKTNSFMEATSTNWYYAIQALSELVNRKMETHFR